MADHRRDPLYRAIQKSMVSITQMVIYDEVKDSMFAEELITLEDLDEFNRIGSNAEAVRRMTMKVMSSIADCKSFLEALQKMPQRKYQELAEIIDKCKRNIEGSCVTQYTSQVVATAQEKFECSSDHPVGNPTDNFQVISQDQVSEMLQEGKECAETLLKQKPEMMSLMKAIPLKRSAGKSFTEFSLYINKLFRKAIENNHIRLKKSVRESNIFQLKECFLYLKSMHTNFCRDDNTKAQIEESLAIVVIQSSKTLDILRSIQKPKFSQSAKIISALLPIFEKITEVVQVVSEINEEIADTCTTFCKLLGSVQDLKVSLVDIEDKLSKTLDTVGYSGALIFAIGGITCLIVGAILLITPASPVGIPIMLAGGLATVLSPVLVFGTPAFDHIIINHIGNSVEETHKKTQAFVEDQPNILDTNALLTISQKFPVVTKA